MQDFQALRVWGRVLLDSWIGGGGRVPKIKDLLCEGLLIIGTTASEIS